MFIAKAQQKRRLQKQMKIPKRSNHHATENMSLEHGSHPAPRAIATLGSGVLVSTPVMSRRKMAPKTREDSSAEHGGSGDQVTSESKADESASSEAGTTSHVWMDFDELKTLFPSHGSSFYLRLGTLRKFTRLFIKLELCSILFS